MTFNIIFDMSRHVNDIVETIPKTEFDEFRHHRGATSYHPNHPDAIIK
jgi:transposase